MKTIVEKIKNDKTIVNKLGLSSLADLYDLEKSGISRDEINEAILHYSLEENITNNNISNTIIDKSNFEIKKNYDVLETGFMPIEIIEYKKDKIICKRDLTDKMEKTLERKLYHFSITKKSNKCVFNKINSIKPKSIIGCFVFVNELGGPNCKIQENKTVRYPAYIIDGKIVSGGKSSKYYEELNETDIKKYITNTDINEVKLTTNDLKECCDLAKDRYDGKKGIKLKDQETGAKAEYGFINWLTQNNISYKNISKDKKYYDFEINGLRVDVKGTALDLPVFDLETLKRKSKDNVPFVILRVNDNTVYLLGIIRPKTIIDKEEINDYGKYTIKTEWLNPISSLIGLN